MENNITKVWIENDSIHIETKTGETKSHPLSWFPRLSNAPKELLENFSLSPFGIHWEELDEDLSYEGFFTYTHQPPVLEKK
ncbi:DUF2442 domain-containing protein [Pedobacter petrophilus]|uniref:DUF2442 domain-containing protein n=1 Tax=Pedobacter petrophilus TaxID=1908241 RepID=A0A7K0FYP9_9SPHI|nr:DUF2442 domain-containing protein [Pedobacter petrophilus]MRX76204.1 DUF2442 domain-containing protein [Pedobacter petrophilus]